MSYLAGLTAAILGNVVIGAGQCMQKYALNHLQQDWETHQQAIQLEGGGSSTSSCTNSMNAPYSTSLDIHSTSNDLLAQRHRSRDTYTRQRSDSLGAAHSGSNEGPRPRYTSKLWILGLLLNYAGEMFGNSLALSYLSASVVAPLGIISVIVNLLLAEKFIGERVTPTQRYGFLAIMAGVGCILLVAPRKPAASDAIQFVEIVSTSGILMLFALYYLIQACLIVLIRKGHQSLFLYVLVASLFGSMNVMVSKIFTMFMRLKMSFSAMPNPADIVFYGAASAYTARPLLFFLTGPQIIAAVVMVLSIVGQESFRQQALGKYPVMQFQPVFFATYNVVATLSGLLLFKELDGWMHAVVFFSAFIIGIGFILYGSRFLQRAKAVELPSHIKLQKSNLGIKSL